MYLPSNLNVAILIHPVRLTSYDSDVTVVVAAPFGPMRSNSGSVIQEAGLRLGLETATFRVLGKNKKQHALQ